MSLPDWSEFQKKLWMMNLTFNLHVLVTNLPHNWLAVCSANSHSAQTLLLYVVGTYHHPIKSWWIKSSSALHYFLAEYLVSHRNTSQMLNGLRMLYILLTLRVTQSMCWFLSSESQMSCPEGFLFIYLFFSKRDPIKRHSLFWGDRIFSNLSFPLVTVILTHNIFSLFRSFICPWTELSCLLFYCPVKFHLISDS